MGMVNFRAPYLCKSKIRWNVRTVACIHGAQAAISRCILIRNRMSDGKIIALRRHVHAIYSAEQLVKYRRSMVMYTSQIREDFYVGLCYCTGLEINWWCASDTLNIHLYLISCRNDNWTCVFNVHGQKYTLTCSSVWLCQQRYLHGSFRGSFIHHL